MSSRFRADRSALLVGIALAAAVLAAGCERERREYHSGPTRAAQPAPRLTTLQPGEALPDPVDPVGLHYQGNAFHVS
ncbi:hypothetical protein, partial [Lysobacter xanthus]